MIAPPTLLGEPLPVDLMNTVWADRDGVHDALRDTPARTAWLQAVRDRVTFGSHVSVTTLCTLRDALRRLAATATADDRPAARSAIPDHATALTVLNNACAAAPTWSRLHWPTDAAPTRARRSAGTPFDTAIGLIAEQAVDLFAGPLRTELRACHAPGCVLYFVRDHPRRQWCGASCGNRARVARHYQAHHAKI
jgi:predicted RNA-binding Zn ribbon-like protein